MKIKITKSSFLDLLGYISLSLFLFTSIFYSTSLYSLYIPQLAYKTIMFLVVVMLVIREILQGKYNFANLTGLLFVSFFVIMFLIRGSITSPILISTIIVFQLRDLPLNRLAKVSIFSIGLSLFLIIISSKIGIVQDYISFRDGKERHYLGFRYALFPSVLWLNFIFLYSYLQHKKTNYLKIIFLISVSTYIYIETGSRLAFITSILVLFFDILLIWKPNLLDKNAKLLYVLSPSYIYSILISWWVLKSFDPFSSIWHTVDVFLGKRISLSLKAIDYFGVKLFGTVVEYTGNALNSQGYKSSLSYLYVDNLYLHISQKYGLVLLIILAVIMTIVTIKLLNRKYYILALITIIISYYCLIDDLMINLYYNFFWMTIGSVLLNKDYNE